MAQEYPERLDARDLRGDWDYRAGETGNLAGGEGGRLNDCRVIALSAIAGDDGGTVTINGGDEIPLQAGQSFSLEFRLPVVEPTIEFDGTTSYFVEVVK